MENRGINTKYSENRSWRGPNKFIHNYRATIEYDFYSFKLRYNVYYIIIKL